MKSAKPRKQRFFRFNAPLHLRQHFINAHLDKPLRAKIGRRAIRVAKGDTVKVMAGSKKGASGKVSTVDLRRGRITITSLTRKNAKGKEIPIQIKPSNVYITDLNLEDKIRAQRLKQERKPAAATPKPPAEKQPAEKIEAKQITK